MESNSQVARVDPSLVPSPEDAVRQYEEAGGHLTHFSQFGSDPLVGDRHLIQEREVRFYQIYPNFDPIFHNLVNNDDSTFCNGLYLFIQITQSLAAQSTICIQ